MDINRALAPLQFRFVHDKDVQKYGPDWFRYSEADFIRRPARELIELEGELGMPIVDVMNGVRAGSALGDTAGAWLGVRETDPDLAGPFDEFNPVTMMIEWRGSQADVDTGKGEGTTEPDPPPATPELAADGYPGLRVPGYATSGPRDTHVLQTSPIAE